VLGVREGGRLLGYTVLRVTTRVQHGFRDAFIMDLTTVPGRSDVAQALLREAVGVFRRAGAPIVRYRFLRSPAAPRPEDLLRLGFFNRNDRSNTLLVKFADETLHAEALSTERWSYNIGDGEATFWLT
jgi:hypothetical protein